MLILVLVLGAFGAGFINGLCGSSGGILLTYVFYAVYRGSERSAKDSMVSAMAAILPISVFSLLTYKNASLSPASVISVVIPSAAGGVIGAVIAHKIPAGSLRLLFAVLVIYAGIKMII